MNLPSLIRRHRCSFALACLIFLIPSILSDTVNAQFLLYADSFNFLLAKILIWFLLPLAVLIAIDSLRISRPVIFWMIICYFLVGISFYLSGSLATAVTLSVILALGWMYAADLLERYGVVFVVASFIVLVFVKYYVFGTDEKVKQFFSDTTVTASAITGLEAKEPYLDLPYSVYIVVFDELSRRALYDGTQLRAGLPNFERLARDSVVPTLSTTNFDVTYLSILTILNGVLPDFSDDTTKYSLLMYSQPNLLDAVAANRVFVWGTQERYCRALRRKNNHAHCLDEYELLANTPPSFILTLDLSRIIHIYLISPIVAITKAAWSIWPVASASQNDVILNYLNGLLRESEVGLWKDQVPRDLQRLDDFVSLAGSVRPALYFFHSQLPHFPYLTNARLEYTRNYRYMAFPFAERRSDIDEIDKSYFSNIQAADTVLGRIIDVIEKRDPHSLLIVTSDHGVARDFDLPLMRATGHLIPDAVEIPIFFRLPPNHPYRNRTVERYQHLDFLPTLYDILSIPAEPSWKGVSVFSGQQSAFYHRSLTARFFKYPP